MLRPRRLPVRPPAPGGFTYVGLLLVVALAGVVLAAAGELWSTTVQREREARLLAVGGELQRALQSYYDASPGTKTPPETLEALLDDRRFPTTRRHLRRIYDDPMTGKKDWGLVRMGGRIVGVHSVSEGRPLRRAGPDGNRDITYRDWVFQINADLPRAEPAPVGNAAVPGAVTQPLPVSSSVNAQPAGEGVRKPAPQPPADEAAARRRLCSERHSAERSQCLALINSDRPAYGRCVAVVANRLTACLDGGEGPPLPTR